MTPQEALKIIDKVHDYPCPYGIGGTAWLIIRNCIEKQIPQKPEKRYPDDLDCTSKFDSCPSCGSFECEYCEYCPDCGQALDWSDTE